MEGSLESSGGGVKPPSVSMRSHSYAGMPGDFHDGLGRGVSTTFFLGYPMAPLKPPGAEGGGSAAQASKAAAGGAAGLRPRPRPQAPQRPRARHACAAANATPAPQRPSGPQRIPLARRLASPAAHALVVCSQAKAKAGPAARRRLTRSQSARRRSSAGGPRSWRPRRRTSVQTRPPRSSC